MISRKKAAAIRKHTCTTLTEDLKLLGLASTLAMHAQLSLPS